MQRRDDYLAPPAADAMQYLETMVRTAPPQKLRLMLIERGVSLCNSIAARWREAKPELGYDEQSLQLRDILTELLSGVGKSDIPVALTVSDLYVFLCKHLTDAELMSDPTMIDEIGLVLQTEAETWRIVCETLAAKTPQPHFLNPARSEAKPVSLNLEG